MMKVYAEWILNGEYHIEFFSSLEEFYEATFCPECEIKVFRMLK